MGARQWEAMNALIAGAMPEWVPEKARLGDARGRAVCVAGNVREMQREAIARVRKHQQRGEVGAQWVHSASENWIMPKLE